MPRPTNKADLLSTAETEFGRLFETVDRVPASRRESTGACAEWSVKDLLAHLDAWHGLFLGWESAGASGGEPDMPAPGLSWAETPTLNERIHQARADEPWESVVDALRVSHEDVLAVVEAYEDDDLFTKRRFAWTGTTSVGAYAVSATSSHYAWASKHIRAWLRAPSDA